MDMDRYMKCYRYLDIEDHEQISDCVYKFVIEHTDILKQNVDKFVPWHTLDHQHVLEEIPQLGKCLKTVFPADILMIAIFYVPPGFEGGVHIDHGDLVYRILWPISNCKGSYTKFFDLNGNQFIDMIGGSEGEAYRSIEKKYPLIEISKAETIKPLIFDAGIPHGIYTNPEYTEPRLTMTIGFDHKIDNLLKSFLNKDN